MEAVTVVIPVGPNPVYRQWLPECVNSVLNQTHKPDEIIFIDDGANFTIADIFQLLKEPGYGSDYYYEGHYNLLNHLSRGCRPTENLNSVFQSNMGGGWYGYDESHEPKHKVHVKYYRTLWNVGVPDAFNFGVALSRNNLVFMIGSDDVMLPTCLEECVKAYTIHKMQAWYTVNIKYMDTGHRQSIPCNTAMVTKKLWEELGGFPPSAGVGACDALLLSIMMVHMPERIIYVKDGEPLCLLRSGDYQDTRANGWLFADEVISIRNKETLRWKPVKERYK